MNQKTMTSVILALMMIATPLSVLSMPSASSGAVKEISLGGGTFGGGDGSAGNPYIITDVLDLQAMGSHLASYFVLGNDIDASATSGWNGGQGFVPVGNDTVAFSGSLDGQGHTIFSLTVNRPANYQGLFGQISSTSMIENVMMEDVYINCWQFRGALVGWNAGGTILNCSSSGIVGYASSNAGGLVGRTVGGYIDNCSSSCYITSTNGNNIGGLVGQAYGNSMISNSRSSGNVQGQTNIGGFIGSHSGDGSTISNCHATGYVTANDIGGGFVGQNRDGSDIFSCYATGDAYVTNNNGAGGFVGNNLHTMNSDTIIQYCYATGFPFGSGSVGGFVGTNTNGQAKILDCYSLGDPTGTNQVGGFVGVETSGAIERCYSTGKPTGSSSVGGFAGWAGFIGSNAFLNCRFDNQTSGTTVGVGTIEEAGDDANVYGNTTTQLMAQATYTGCDFTTVWWMTEGSTRPFLRMEWATEVRNSHQMQLMAMSLGAAYTLENYIDMWDTKVSSGMWGTNATSGKGFSPVGSWASKFVGSFDGQGNVIGNLYIKSTADYVGLFGGSNGQIMNLEMGGIQITGHNYVGGLVGRLQGDITNCGAQGSVQGYDSVGGLVGEIYFGADLVNGSTNTIVTGHDYTGGLAGSHSGNQVSQSYSLGQVTGNQCVGGLLGSGQSPVMLSTSRATVQGALFVGGFIGDNSCDVDNCTAYGDVTGIGAVKQQIGGFVGSNYGNIKDSYSWGDVSGNYYIGGFIGQDADNTGKKVRNSYSTGKVTAISDVGGFLGYYMPGATTTYTNCFWDNQTSNQTTSARGAGRGTADMMQQATFTNWDFTNTWGIYETNTYPFLQAMGPDYVPQADLEITIDDMVDPVQLGGVISYHVTLTNHGPDNAVNVVANITLPPESSILNQTASLHVGVGYLYSDPQNVANGQTLEMMFNVSADSAGTGTLTCTVTVTQDTPDPGLNTASETTQVNTPPDATNASAQTDEDTQISGLAIWLQSYISDPDPDTITIISHEPSDFGAALTIYPNGSFSYDPTVSATLQALHGGVFVNDTFNYTVSDGRGGFDTALMTVMVEGIEGYPTAVNDTVSVDEDGGPQNLLLMGNDIVDEEGDAFRIHNAWGAAHGTLTVPADGSAVIYTPTTANYSGYDTFMYSLRDSNNATSDPASVNVTVTQVNDPPVTYDNEFTVDEDSGPNTLWVLEHAYDAESDDLTISAVTQPPHGTTAITEAGKNLTYEPDENFFGTDFFNYTLSDGTDTNVFMVTVTVASVNDNPAITTAALPNATVGTPYFFNVTAEDIDSADLTFSAAGLPAGLAISAGGAISGTPTTAGSYQVNVTATDDASGFGTKTFTLTVNPSGNATVTDSDGDGIPDSEDAFPDDPDEWLDTDGDGIGNNADTDDDGDGVSDAEDAFPLDPTESVDTDGDGVGDNSDAFPTDPAASVDADGDGLPDAWNPGYTADDSTTGLVLDDDPTTPYDGGTDDDTGGNNTWLYIIIILVVVAVVGAALFLKGKGKEPAPAIEPASPAGPETPTAEPAPTGQAAENSEN